MSLYELLSFTDDEIEVITSSVCGWSEKNRVDIQSERGRAAMRHAITLVSSGVRAREEIGAKLNERFTASATDQE